MVLNVNVGASFYTGTRRFPYYLNTSIFSLKNSDFFIGYNPGTCSALGKIDSTLDPPSQVGKVRNKGISLFERPIRVRMSSRATPLEVAVRGRIRETQLPTPFLQSFPFPVLMCTLPGPRHRSLVARAVCTVLSPGLCDRPQPAGSRSAGGAVRCSSS